MSKFGCKYTQKKCFLKIFLTQIPDILKIFLVKIPDILKIFWLSMYVYNSICSSSPKWTQKMIINYLYF